MNGWKTGKLGDVCNVRRGSVITKKQANPGDVPVMAGGIGPAYYHDTPNRDANVITVSGSGANAGFVNFFDRPIWASDCSTIQPHGKALDVRYVYLFLLSMQRFINENLRQGAAQPHVYPKDLAKLQIPLPAREEQKRIVAVLDQAFAALDRARANANANLADAEELFEASLAKTFQTGGDGWEPCEVGDLLTLQRGHDITKKDQREGSVPVVSSGGVRSYHDEAKVSGPGVVVGRKGSIGTVHFIQEDYWPHDTTLYVKDFKGNDALLVSYLMRGLKLAKLDTGAANPSLNRNLVHPMRVTWPTGGEQSAIAKQLFKVEEQANGLVDRYLEKLDELDDLRQSILQKAFAGELT